MNSSHLIQIIGFAAPLFSALVSCGLCLSFYLSRNGEGRQKHILLMVFTFLAAALCWLAPLLLIVVPSLFVRLNPLFFLALMLNQVLLYHFVFIITGMQHRRRFSPLNYIIPVFVTVAVLVWSAWVPYDVLLEIACYDGFIHPDYPVSSALFFSSILVFCIYNILYTVLGFYRVGQYRRHVADFSADAERTSLRWLYAFMWLVLSNIPLPLAALFVDKDMILGSNPAVACALLPIVQYMLIVYNVISGNYVIIPPVSGSEDSPEAKTAKLSRKRFEVYIHACKPYLDPGLTITDLAVGLHTNRTYLSNFINREYGMNFSRYINRLRLEELDRLRTSSQSMERSNVELVLQAGFSNYRSYVRVKGEEDERRVLKLFD